MKGYFLKKIIIITAIYKHHGNKKSRKTLFLNFKKLKKQNSTFSAVEKPHYIISFFFLLQADKNLLDCFCYHSIRSWPLQVWFLDWHEQHHMRIFQKCKISCLISDLLHQNLILIRYPGNSYPWQSLRNTALE